METKRRSNAEIEELVLRQAQMGVDAAQAKLVRDNYAYVKSFLRRFERDEWELEDLCQDVFVNAISGLKKFRSDCSFKSWLTSIARNTAIDRIRGKSVRSRHSVEVMQLALRRWQADDQSSYGKGDLRDEQLAMLGECVDALSPNARELIDAYYFQSQSAQSMSEQLGRSAGSIRMALMRVRQWLAKCVQKKGRTSGNES